MEDLRKEMSFELDQMGGIHTFEKVLKVRGQNMIYFKGAEPWETFLWNIITFYCYILRA